MYWYLRPKIVYPNGMESYDNTGERLSSIDRSGSDFLLK
jgi:hypothetical protein